MHFCLGYSWLLFQLSSHVFIIYVQLYSMTEYTSVQATADRLPVIEPRFLRQFLLNCFLKSVSANPGMLLEDSWFNQARRWEIYYMVGPDESLINSCLYQLGWEEVLTDSWMEWKPAIDFCHVILMLLISGCS